MPRRKTSAARPSPAQTRPSERPAPAAGWLPTGPKRTLERTLKLTQKLTQAREAAVAVAAAATPEPAPEPAAAATDGKPHKRVLTGTVVSNGSEQGIVVRISHRKKHRLYKKYRTLSRKVMAHDPGNDCEVGDLVRVIESRPLSKMKRWRLIEIVKRAS